MNKKSESTSKTKVNCKTSKELLLVEGNGGVESVVKSLLKNKESRTQNKKSFQTFKIERSPLLNQLEEFLPKFGQSTTEILEKSKDERDQLDIENIDGCSSVLEMNILMEDENASDSDDSDSPSDGKETPSICPETLVISRKTKLGDKKKKNLIKEVKDLNNVGLKVCKEKR